jgi:signal transduction histidine kinase
MKFRNLKLSTKQMIGFGFILIMMAAVNVFSVRKMASLKNEIDEVSTNWLPRALAISDINTNTSHLRTKQLQHAFAINEAEKQELFASFDEKWDEYQEQSIFFFTLSLDNKTREALDLLNGPVQTVFNELGNNLEKLVELTKRDSRAAARRADFTFRSTRRIVTFLLIVTIFLSVFISGGLVRLITIPVRQLEKAAKTVADGNLNIYLEAFGNDEIGNLTRSFNQMTRSLREAREQMEKQAQALQKTNTELEEKSRLLEQQKKEIIQKNLDIYTAMEELKATQEQLIMKEKMAALGSLVAGVAHEINTPIGTVNSSTDVSDRCINKIEIVLEQSQSIEDIRNNDQLPKALKILKENIKVTMTAGDRIAMLVKSLKNFARLDESEYQMADIHEGIESSLTLLGSEFMQRIKLTKEYGNIPQIGCYPAQLNQVFLNVLKNARQAIEDNGTIHIKTFLEDAPGGRNKQVHIQISDNGRGIPAEQLKKIFDFGFSAREKRVKMGSGLSTAYSVIQKHSGEIRLQSEVGKGTAVSIILPVQ